MFFFPTLAHFPHETHAVDIWSNLFSYLTIRHYAVYRSTMLTSLLVLFPPPQTLTLYSPDT